LQPVHFCKKRAYRHDERLRDSVQKVRKRSAAHNKPRKYRSEQHRKLNYAQKYKHKAFDYLYQYQIKFLLRLMEAIIKTSSTAEKTVVLPVISF
jgi:hypothetical protein